MIKIVGLGPGAKEALTLGTLDVLKDSDKIYLRTKKHPTVEYLQKENIEFETFDDKYETYKSFDQVYEAIAKDIIETHEKYKEVVYAVPGHPLVAEKSVNNLIEMCEDKSIEFKIYPAVSFIDAMIEALKIDPINGIKVIDAFDINNQILDKRADTIITQVYDMFIASEAKLKLSSYYGDDYEIYFIRAAGVQGEESIRKIKLYQLDRQKDIDYLTSLYIPKDVENKIKDFNDLLGVMDVLRSEDGCDWDRKQTHNSLKRYLIEESYEVLEAIDNEDDNELIEELGDVLFQIIFHAQIGKEEGYFDINDVIKEIYEKMVRRHPHIFKDNNCEVLANQVEDKWDEIKKEEKGFKTHTEGLKHIAKVLPALIRAEKVQKKAAKVNFDFKTIEDAMNKVSEEFEELNNVYKNKNKEKILEEVGDLIFTVVNIARFLDIDPEYALNYSIDKFINRFEYIEKVAAKKGISLEDMTLDDMNILWEDIKNQ